MSNYIQRYASSPSLLTSPLGVASYLNQYKEILKPDGSSKSILMALTRFKHLNFDLSEPKQPAHTKLIGSGKAKLVYTGYRNALSLNPIDDVVYLVSKKKLGQNNELHEEVEIGKNIKQDVYRANLRLFIQALCQDKKKARQSADLISIAFPDVIGVIRGLYTKDPRLMNLLPPNSLFSGVGYDRAVERLTETALHLNVDFLEAPGILIDGKPAVIAKRAQNDLENAIRKKPSPFPENAKLAYQLMKGFRDLHSGGYVHGDLKLENILLYFLDGKPIIKISDWGKTKHLNDHQVGFHAGNRRHMAPERLLSQKGETFGIAMMAVRLLEEEFINTDPKGMLVTPDPKDGQKEKILKDEKDLTKCRKGIERYLSLCQDCPERDTRAIDVIPHAIGTVNALAIKCPNNIDPQVTKYLDALQERLTEKYGATPEKRAAIGNLVGLFRAMMLSNRDERNTMEEAVPRFEQILLTIK